MRLPVPGTLADVPQDPRVVPFLPGCRPVVRDQDGSGGIVLSLPEGKKGIAGCVFVYITLEHLPYAKVGDVLRIHTSKLTIERYL